MRISNYRRATERKQFAGKSKRAFRRLRIPQLDKLKALVCIKQFYYTAAAAPLSSDRTLPQLEKESVRNELHKLKQFRPKHLSMAREDEPLYSFPPLLGCNCLDRTDNNCRFLLW